MSNIIVIGASSGMGREIARTYAARGHRVGACARRADRLHELKSEYDANITTCVLDVTADDAADIFDRFVTTMGGLDILIYCAGCGWNNPQLDPEKDMRTVRTNVDGLTAILGTAFNILATQGPASLRRGQIAVLTSIAGTRGIGISATYSASKRYQWTYLEALAQLARVRNVPVDITDIRPGFVDTPLLDTTAHNYPMLMSLEEATAHVINAIDRRRHAVVINCRWAVLTAIWRRIPRPLWRNFKLKF